MYDHIGLKVGNLDASVRFYTAVLAPLGYVLCSRDETGAGFGPKGEPALWLYLHKGPAAAGSHIAFRAPDQPPSPNSTSPASRRAAATTALPARAPTTARPTSPRS
jgi:catechol 2,3-dioxygenase-like lactoylglutathione lyase family enzyme